MRHRRMLAWPGMLLATSVTFGAEGGAASMRNPVWPVMVPMVRE